MTILGGAWVWFSFTQAHSHSHCWLELTGNGVTKKLSHLAAPIWLDTHEVCFVFDPILFHTDNILTHWWCHSNPTL
jgi:hypothetical protein